MKPKDNGGAVIDQESSRDLAALCWKNRMKGFLSVTVFLLCLFDIAAAYEPSVRDRDYEKTVHVAVGKRFSLILDSNRKREHRDLLLVVETVGKGKAAAKKYHVQGQCRIRR